MWDGRSIEQTESVREHQLKLVAKPGRLKPTIQRAKQTLPRVIPTIGRAARSIQTNVTASSLVPAMP